MRYIGSKENLLGFIESVVAAHGFTEGVFCDLFAGTTTVGRHFKRKGFSVISNDLMEYSYVFGKAYLENNEILPFARLNLPRRGQHSLFETGMEALQSVLDYLNALPAEQGFMFRHYSDVGTQAQTHQRMFFSAENAGKMDAIRNQITCWRQTELISEPEYYVLLAALIEAVPGVSNTTGTYAAFLKFWEARSKKLLTLERPFLITSNKTHRVFRENGNKLLPGICCDVIYLDPPYNSRQYAPNYHILETLARWDSPLVYGKTGIRPYTNEKSVYCSKETALAALSEAAQNAQCRLFLLSYNSEGIMPHEAICDTLAVRGHVSVVEQEYRRYRSDSDHAKRKYKPEKTITERLYIIRTEP